MGLRCLLVLLLAAPAFAQNVQQQRTDIVTSLITTERPEKAAQQRWNCINGNETSRVEQARAAGMDFTPDASDSCVAALQRAANDKTLLDIYRRFLVETGGSTDMYEKLPKAIGASVLSGDGKVSIGNGKAISVTAPIAFDAGFTVACTDHAAKKAADPQKLKALAQSCFSNEKEAGTCFSVGYVYGSQAFNAR